MRCRAADIVRTPLQSWAGQSINTQLTQRMADIFLGVKMWQFQCMPICITILPLCTSGLEILWQNR